MEHTGIILIIVLVICILTPLFVHLCYNSQIISIKTNISADGMLGSIGACCGSIVALSIALIGVYKEKQHEEEMENLRIENRRNEIRPRFQVELKLREDSCFDVTFSNHNKYPAFDIYFIDRNVLPLVKDGQPKTIKVCFDLSKDILDAYYFDCEMSGEFPEYFWIVYCDVDGNVISEKFQHYLEDENHFYQRKDLGYEG